ncbi:alpha/beta hydrolase [Actinomyces slackii]|uniref:Arylesterase n=2 Tax=Actinomyces slackii TaxID=52774 RepID=A0A3S4UPD0_9ACTO|nr:Arylesterase [Actinomyces slackii]
MLDLETIRVKPTREGRGTTVLFVHGGYFAAWCWEKFQPYLADRGYGSWAVSLRGHGASRTTQPLRSLRLEQYVEDVVETLKAMPTRPVVVGHSMGGGIVQKVLGADEDLVSGVVLLSSVPPSGVGGKEALAWTKLGMGAMVKLWKLHSGKLGPEDAADRTAFPYGMFFAGDLDKDTLVSYGSRMQGESQRAGKQLSRTVLRDPKSVGVPVAVIGGEEDLFFAPQVNHATADVYGVDATIVSGVGHAAMLDSNWVAVADRLIDFLESLEER